MINKYEIVDGANWRLACLHINVHAQYDSRIVVSHLCDMLWNINSGKIPTEWMNKKNQTKTKQQQQRQRLQLVLTEKPSSNQRQWWQNAIAHFIVRLMGLTAH